MDLRIPIRHPGPPAPAPYQIAIGSARRVRVTLEAGKTLMQAVDQAMKAERCQSGVIQLDGLAMGPYDFVMPDLSTDGVHAAWYSPTHHGDRATIQHGSAIVGQRGGTAWLHAHAAWTDDATGDRAAGHLLPDDVILPVPTDVDLYAFSGGAFDVSLNEETQFSIFHPTGGEPGGNAAIIKVNPHHDITGAIRDAVQKAGLQSGRIMGVGSLIGARFSDGAPEMVSTISEIFVLPDARFTPEGLHLPVFCVDPQNGQFQGPLAPGTSPVCVTFELMLVEQETRPG